MPQFVNRLFLVHPAEAVYALLSNPAQRVCLVPPDWHARLLEAPEVITSGARLRVEVRHFGLPRAGVSEFPEVVPAAKIVERQVEGPFRSWVHTQELAEAGASTTLIDTIDYELPGGMLGLLLTARVVEGQLTAWFAFRDRELAELLARG